MEALIAESDFETLDNISQAFKICLPDCKLVTTDSGKQCLDMVKDKCPDVVILGIDLADMSGFDVIEQIRCCSEVPVIVLSYINDESVVVQTLEMGADGYMGKPIHQLELIARIRALLRRSKVL